MLNPGVMAWPNMTHLPAHSTHNYIHDTTKCLSHVKSDINSCSSQNFSQLLYVALIARSASGQNCPVCELLHHLSESPVCVILGKYRLARARNVKAELIILKVLNLALSTHYHPPSLHLTVFIGKFVTFELFHNFENVVRIRTNSFPMGCPPSPPHRQWGAPSESVGCPLRRL